MSDLRGLPAVDQVLSTPRLAGLIEQYGRPLAVQAARAVLAEIRDKKPAVLPDLDEITQLAARLLVEWLRPTLLPVINASGVVLHTNLGRAPLSSAAIQAMSQVAGSYNTLEFDLAGGKRGSRSLHAENLLTRLTGAEAALVVNNNAAAVLLILSALARRKRVIISRTQLVEIGGGFRIPDVMAQSGARLVEVGATNRVHLSDYENALAEPAALILRAHRSNFRLVGFTAEPEMRELTDLAHRFGLPFVDDLGSGTLLDTARFGLPHEPTISDSLAAGADVVCFSGDKLLGGPQAGIIVGKRDLIGRIKKHPLARAVRADKLQLAALTATLEHYLKDEAEKQIPIWRMISAQPAELQQRAERWCEQVGTGEVSPSLSTIGGGSLPEESLPTYVLRLHLPSPDRFLTGLRGLQPPVIARVEDDCVLLDPRTVLPEQEDALLTGLAALLAHTPKKKESTK